MKVPRLDLIWQGEGGAGNGPEAGKRNAINAMIALLLLRQMPFGDFKKISGQLSQDNYNFRDLKMVLG